MTTALDLIKRSLRLLGVYRIGEDLSPEESTDGLAALNDLLDELSNTPMVYAKTLDSIALAAGATSVTVGPSGTTVTARPVQVLSDSYVLVDTTSYPVEVLTLAQYTGIAYKAQTGIPSGIYPQMDMPDITVTPWPVPSEAMTLKLWSVKILASFPTLTTTVSLPPGYKNALANLLAEAVAPEYSVQVPIAVAQAAARGRRLIERTNFEAPMLDMPPELVATRFDILTGTWQ